MPCLLPPLCRAPLRVAVTLMVCGAWVSSSASDDCDAPAETWQPRAAVHALAERKHWRVDALKIDDGCYEIKGRDAEGHRFRARIDPATLQVLRLRREHGGGERERERDRQRERERERERVPEGNVPRGEPSRSPEGTPSRSGRQATG